ncbi:MAG: glycoside hydrolase family 31 protein [Deltaproteobacteria bacterium]|nr:glycoside hydrolase family 31 protein [Deltaproteobacteria bacterium]
MLRQGLALVVVIIGLGAGCARVDDDDDDAPRSATSVSVIGGAEPAFVIARAGLEVGRSSSDPRCPLLSVALRLPSDDGKWIDVTDAVPRADVETLSATKAFVVKREDTLLGSVLGAEFVLTDASGIDRGRARLTARDGSEDGVDVDVAFDFDPVDVAYVAACFALAPGEHVVGGGEVFAGADLRGSITPLVFSAPAETASGTNEAHAPVPFFATTRGLSVLVETERVGAFDVDSSVPGALQLRFLGNTLPLRIRAAAVNTEGPARELVVDNVRANARRMGLGKAPPRWALAPMQWRNDLEVEVGVDGTLTSTGVDMLNGDVDALTSLGLPFSSVWIDAPWQTGYNTFVVNDVQLPGFDDVMTDLADHGLHALVWATEHVNTSDDQDQMVGMPAFASRALYEEFRDAGFLVVVGDTGEPFTFPWGRGQGAFVDFTNPAACAAWQDNMRPLLERGVRGFKLDYGESMRPDLLGLLENTIPAFSDGTTTAVQHTRYARLYHECYAGALTQVHGDDWFIITRTGGLYDQRNGVAIWPGDVDSDFSRFGDRVDGENAVGGLPSAIGAYLSLAMSGYPLYGSDIGGYRGGRVTPEAFARWSEFGALSTIMQVGGGSNHAPWDPFLDDVGAAEFADAARLHMSLWPMFERWIARASIGGDGQPVVVPLGVALFEDQEAWADREAFILGNVLAAYPVVTDGARSRVVRLPPGGWIDQRSGQRFKGPLTTTVAAPLGSMPLFLRAGAVLVLDEESQTLLPSTLRTGPSSARVIVTSGGPQAKVEAGGLVVGQDTAAFVTAIVVSGAASSLRLEVWGRFGTVRVDGAEVLEVITTPEKTVIQLGETDDVLIGLENE